MEKRLVEAHGMVGTLLSCNLIDESSNLSDTEKMSIDHVVDKLGPMTVAEIIEASHQETGWHKCSVAHCHIAYDEAFNLKLI